MPLQLTIHLGFSDKKVLIVTMDGIGGECPQHFGWEKNRKSYLSRNMDLQVP